MNPFWRFIWAEDNRRGGSTAEQSFELPPMVAGGAGAIPARKELDWRLGKVEEELGKMLTQGIKPRRSGLAGAVIAGALLKL